MHNTPFCCFAFVLFIFIGHASAHAQDETPFPADAAINVVTHFGFDNTGVADVTDGLNQLILFLYQNGPSQTIYFPNGTYKLTGQINWYNPISWSGGITIAGESRAGTVLQLVDNAVGYETSSNPKHLIDTGPATNNAIYNFLCNLTINTGSGNPGVVCH